jgi:predicted nucleotidyltransferase
MAGILYTQGMEFDADVVFDVVSRRLPEAGVSAVMIGGHAVNYYGVSRATQDIDFMVAATDEDAVRRVMQEAGFTNISLHETVMFFNRPGSPLRVDFLKVERETLETLLANAKEVDYFGGHGIRVPQLRDLLGMKIFALSNGGAKREDKDFWDIVHLVIENHVSVEEDLHELCRQFGTETIYTRLSAQIRGQKND